MGWWKLFGDWDDDPSPLEMIPNKEERKDMASWEIMLLVGIAILMTAWVLVERLF